VLALVLAPLATEMPEKANSRRRVGLVPVALWGGLFVGYVAYATVTG
jgi:hypothetical protein